MGLSLNQPMTSVFFLHGCYKFEQISLLWLANLMSSETLIVFFFHFFSVSSLPP